MNLSGQRFGSLVAIALLRSPGVPSRWSCQCDCGVHVQIVPSSLRSGNTSSCGCMRFRRVAQARTTHGGSQTATYVIWGRMKSRCASVRDSSYDRYGARGIRVCARWRESYANFLADMGVRPSGVGRGGRAAYSIDRINNDRGYSCGKCDDCATRSEPANCRWASATEQSRNRPDVLTLDQVLEVHGRIEHGESRRSVAGRMGIPRGTVDRLRRGDTWQEFATRKLAEGGK